MSLSTSKIEGIITTWLIVSVTYLIVGIITQIFWNGNRIVLIVGIVSTVSAIVARIMIRVWMRRY